MKSIALLLLVCVAASVAINCDNDEIACSDSEKCIPQRYICDSDDDCHNSSDEDAELCEAWKNPNCDRNYVECTRNGETNCVEVHEYCTTENPLCEGDLDRRICLMLESGSIGKLSNFTLLPNIDVNNLIRSNELAERFNAVLPNTISHDNCPSMYTLVGDQCISFFYIGSMSWGEARAFCKVLNGDLLTFRNISQFTDIVRHLQRYELPSDFWIGGSLNNTTGWTWQDGSPMEMGSPYWATRYSPTCIQRNVTTAPSETICDHYYQAPEEVPKAECVSLSFEHSFYMTDEDCLRKMSPLCVYDGLPKTPKF